MGYSDDFASGMQLISEIVATLPPSVCSFFDSLVAVRKSPKSAEEIHVLNHIINDDLKHSTTPQIATWLEVFRNIYIMHCLEQEKSLHAPKRPLFTTFNLTFEELALTPDYWFENRTITNQNNFYQNASPLLLMIERYMYNQNGGNCWSALDWEMDKYAFRVVCEPMRSQNSNPVRHLASLYLTARAVVRGELGLYIGRNSSIELPYIGVKIDRENPATVLKSFHYDRFTKLSYIRHREMNLDSIRQVDTSCFETDWMATAAVAEFTIQEKNARATRTTCTRVMLEEFSDCLKELARSTALGDDSTYLKVIETMQNSFDDIDLSFAQKSPEELLADIGLAEKVSLPDYYLAKIRIGDAQTFWSKAEPIMSEIIEKFNRYRFDTVPQFTAREFAKHHEAELGTDALLLINAVVYRHINELQGTLYGERLRLALKNAIIHGQFELQYSDLATILLGLTPPEKIGIISLSAQRCETIPTAWLQRNCSTTLQYWAEELLTDWAEKSFKEPVNPKSRSKKVEDKKSKPHNYLGQNLSSVINSADRIWNTYFSEEEACANRWLLSIRTAISCLNKGKVKSFTIPGSADSKLQQITKLKSELIYSRQDTTLITDKELRNRVENFDGFTFANVSSKERNLVLLNILARLMVATASKCPVLWNDPMGLNSLFTHILIATLPDVDKPFPWHIGVLSDSYLRISRDDNNQCDNITRLLERRFTDATEQQILLVFLTKYLNETDSPIDVLDKMLSNQALSRFFGEDRLRMTRLSFGGSR